MKTKIICPVDFSDAANNAIEYAAKLAKVIDADITLVNVLQVAPIMALSGISDKADSDVKKNTLAISNSLKLISDETHGAYNIPVDYEVEVTTKSLAKTLSSHSEKNTMIIMGTNGADDMSQFFFGTHTYDVIKKVECPVLLVPENSIFNGYNHVLYPLLYKEKDKLALFQFYEFIKTFKTRITFLQVSKKDTVASREVFNAEKEEVEELFKERPDLYFERVFSEDIDEDIDDYAFENSIDLLVIAAHHRNILESIFGKRSILSGLTAIAPCPILVFHS